MSSQSGRVAGPTAVKEEGALIRSFPPVLRAKATLFAVIPTVDWSSRCRRRVGGLRWYLVEVGRHGRRPTAASSTQQRAQDSTQATAQTTLPDPRSGLRTPHEILITEMTVAADIRLAGFYGYNGEITEVEAPGRNREGQSEWCIDTEPTTATLPSACVDRCRQFLGFFRAPSTVCRYTANEGRPRFATEQDLCHFHPGGRSLRSPEHGYGRQCHGDRDPDGQHPEPLY